MHSDQAPREIELKFVLDGPAARKILRHPLLADVGCERQSQRSVYFDTSKARLKKKGYSLRVRQIGNKFTQTLKTSGSHAGLFDRCEWEMPVAGLEPDTKLFSRTPNKKLQAISGELEPVSQSDVERTSWLISHRGSAIELVLDTGDTSGSTRSASFHEVEIELKQGERADLFALARILLESAPLRLGVLTKEERGRELTRDLGHIYKASKLKFDDRMTVEQVFSQIIMSCIRHFRLNETLIRETREPEALHQARTAMRRLRGALILFRPAIRKPGLEPLRSELRWFTRSLAAARDIDVFIAGHDDLKWTDRRKLQSARTEAYDQACAAIDSQRLRTLLLDLVEWLSIGNWQKSGARDPIVDFAAGRLDFLWKKVRNSSSDLFELDDELLHRFRIRIKNLRYAVEFFQSLYGKKAGKFASRLADIQDGLGRMNDEAIGRQLIDALSLRNADLAPQVSRVQCLLAVQKQFKAIRKAGRFWA